MNTLRPSTPCSSYSSLSRLHSATRREGESAEERESAVSEEEEVQEGVTLALVGRDSSILYCQMWPGVHLPIS